LKKIGGFISHTRDYFHDIIPPAPFPNILKVRIFDYLTSDPLAGMRPLFNGPVAMRAHIDGSLVTLVIAESDGLLHFQHHGKWHIAGHLDQRPFAILLPGIAARDFGILPTSHKVLPNIDHRVSVTIFLTPMLSTNREIADRQLENWRLKKAA
jgi:hypothetical protein